MGDDEWVKVAMTDVSMVAELLMRLNHSKLYALPPAKRTAPVVPLKWGVRQPRSRQILRCNTVQVKKESGSTRASPTTPLSWSGGTSFSGGGGGGYEESSRPVKRLSSDRSKVTATCETTIRRSRKKKTFVELKEEESLLMKERIYLKKELTTLRITLEEQSARNKSLKRMKLDLHPQLAKKANTASDASEKAISDQSHPNEAAAVDHTPTILPTSVTCDEILCPSPPLDTQVERKDVVTWESSFVLPDLNLPIEEDSGSEVLYGMS